MLKTVTITTVLSSHLKIDLTKVFMENSSFVTVQNIAEMFCNKLSTFIKQYSALKPIFGEFF